MRLRRTPLPSTSEEDREHSIERAVNLCRRALWDRVRDVAWEVKEWWFRHITQRELYRQLDNLLAAEQKYGLTDALRRLRVDFLYSEQGHQRSHEDQP